MKHKELSADNRPPPEARGATAVMQIALDPSSSATARIETFFRTQPYIYSLINCIIFSLHEILLLSPLTLKYPLFCLLYISTIMQVFVLYSHIVSQHF